MKRDYRKLYNKYKIKYIELKNEKNLYNMLDRDLMEGLLSLDFLHDNARSLVKGKIFYDMINGKKITVTDKTMPKDIESIIHNYFIKLSNNEESVLSKDYEMVKNKLRIQDFGEYTAIYDISTDNDEMRKKLGAIFNLTKSKETFILNCEKFLKKKTLPDDSKKKGVDKEISNLKIPDEFLENGNLKDEYLLEAIRVGFNPISRNSILNYNNFSKRGLAYYEYKKLIEFSKEMLEVLKEKDFESELNKDFISDLEGLKICDPLIKSKEDFDNKFFPDKLKKGEKKKPDKDLNVKIHRLILSMKEARDIYYIEEIKNMKKGKYILVSGDLIQSYRAILANISSINVMLSIIRFIGLYYRNKLNLIGNPFELLSSNVNTMELYKTPILRKIFRGIIQNPILQFSPKGIKLKYVLKENNIMKEKYWIDCANLLIDDECESLDEEMCNIKEYLDLPEECSQLINLKEKKKLIDKAIKFAEININNIDELLFVLRRLNSLHDNSFSRFINYIETYKETSFKDKDKDFYVFLFLLGTTVFGGIFDIEYMLPLLKELYPKRFNYDEIEKFF